MAKIFLSFLIFFVATTVAQSDPIKFRRGVSIHEWLNWSPVSSKTLITTGAHQIGAKTRDSNEYIWPPYQKRPVPITASDLEAIRKQGFDFVRLSIDPGPVLSVSGERRSEALSVLGNAVKLVLASGLKVVFDYHPVGQVPAYSAKAFEVKPDEPAALNYKQMVADTALMLSTLVPHASDFIAFELFNEPQFYPCDGAGGRNWQETLEGLITSARRAAPELTLIVSGACGGGVKGLINLDPKRLKDSNLLYSFHYYENHIFTHQGGKGKRWLTAVPWPPSQRTLDQSIALCMHYIHTKKGLSLLQRANAKYEARRLLEKYYRDDKGIETVRDAFKKLVSWSEKNRIPLNHLFMGEFGVIAATNRRAGAEPADRLRWLSFVRKQAESYDIGWAYWEYNNVHGMSLTTNTKSREFDPVAIRALGLERNLRSAY